MQWMVKRLRKWLQEPSANLLGETVLRSEIAQLQARMDILETMQQTDKSNSPSQANGQPLINLEDMPDAHLGAQ
tara:strand:- start:140 stop:361 length:222 start_codon:yes stop_codon:yes gene_type:complete